MVAASEIKQAAAGQGVLEAVAESPTNLSTALSR